MADLTMQAAQGAAGAKRKPPSARLSEIAPDGPGMVTSSAEFAEASADYLRLRAAYVELAACNDPNEVAMAMVGADLEVAAERMQRLAGLPFFHSSLSACAVLREEARRARC